RTSRRGVNPHDSVDRGRKVLSGNSKIAMGAVSHEPCVGVHSFGKHVWIVFATANDVLISWLTVGARCATAGRPGQLRFRVVWPRPAKSVEAGFTREVIQRQRSLRWGDDAHGWTRPAAHLEQLPGRGARRSPRPARALAGFVARKKSGAGGGYRRNQI